MTTLNWDHAEHALKTIGQLGLEDGKQLTLFCQCMSPIATAIKDGQICSHSDLKKLLKEAKKSADVPQALKQYLQALEKLVLRPTDGKRTIKGETALFGTRIYLYDGFADLEDKVQATNETQVDMSELVQDGKFAEFLPPRQVFQHEEQVLVFCEDYRDRLRKGGYVTFLPFMKDGKVFVAYVGVSDDGFLWVRVYALSYDGVWGGGIRRRVVVPQQSLKP